MFPLLNMNAVAINDNNHPLSKIYFFCPDSIRKTKSRLHLSSSKTKKGFQWNTLHLLQMSNNAYMQLLHIQMQWHHMSQSRWGCMKFVYTALANNTFPKINSPTRLFRIWDKNQYPRSRSCWSHRQQPSAYVLLYSSELCKFNTEFVFIFIQTPKELTELGWEYHRH